MIRMYSSNDLIFKYQCIKWYVNCFLKKKNLNNKKLFELYYGLIVIVIYIFLMLIYFCCVILVIQLVFFYIWLIVESNLSLKTLIFIVIPKFFFLNYILYNIHILSDSIIYNNFSWNYQTKKCNTILKHLFLKIRRPRYIFFLNNKNIILIIKKLNKPINNKILLFFLQIIWFSFHFFIRVFPFILSQWIFYIVMNIFNSKFKIIKYLDINTFDSFFIGLNWLMEKNSYLFSYEFVI